MRMRSDLGGRRCAARRVSAVLLVVGGGLAAWTMIRGDGSVWPAWYHCAAVVGALIFLVVSGARGVRRFVWLAAVALFVVSLNADDGGLNFQCRETAVFGRVCASPRGEFSAGPAREELYVGVVLAQLATAALFVVVGLGSALTAQRRSRDAGDLSAT